MQLYPKINQNMSVSYHPVVFASLEKKIYDASKGNMITNSFPTHWIWKYWFGRKLEQARVRQCLDLKTLRHASHLLPFLKYSIGSRELEKYFKISELLGCKRPPSQKQKRSNIYRPPLENFHPSAYPKCTNIILR